MLVAVVVESDCAIVLVVVVIVCFNAMVERTGRSGQNSRRHVDSWLGSGEPRHLHH
jgi:hypothetical protein